MAIRTTSGGHPEAAGVANEEASRHPDLFVCRQLRSSWPEFWARIRSFS